MSLDGALELLSRIVRDGGVRSVAEIAHDAGIPLSTAQRWTATLERHGLLAATARGRRVAGANLLAMAMAGELDVILRTAALPLLRRFAIAHGTTVHLGVWDGEMVSYLAKTCAGSAVFTREGMKLEGYCSALGKILLAHVSAEKRNLYLAAGPFVALTERTIILPEHLRRELIQVAEEGYALDQAEVQEGLYCHAVPLRDHDGQVVAAISESCTAPIATDASGSRARLAGLAVEIEAVVFPYRR